MHFAHPIPIWLACVVAALVAAIALAAYRRPLTPLTTLQRSVLVGLRVLAISALVVFLMRPVAWRAPAGPRDAVVPILVDVSKSMRLADAGGQSRLARALAVVRSELEPALSTRFRTEILAVADGVAPLSASAPSAEGAHSELTHALATVADRYRGDRVAAVVLVSDGGDTSIASGEATSAAAVPAWPIFAVGVGSATGPRDREVIAVTAGEQRLDRASVDVRVLAASRGFGRAPFELRLSADGRVVDTRRVTPSADGAPVDELFTALPNADRPTVYTAEIAVDPGEDVPENNSRQIVVPPAGRKRRVLMLEGAPGFEQSFIKRAWALDPALEVDAIVRKGKNADGRDTFMVQAAAARAASLAGGFPARKDDLYAYDAVVLSNVEGDVVTRSQLTSLADFVAERGGGLLVMGGRSFSPRGLIGTALEEALPVELNDRRTAIVRQPAPAAVATSEREEQQRAGVGPRAHMAMPTSSSGPLKVAITADGEAHALMRLGATAEDTRRSWAALPALAAVAPLGGPRAGGTVLATTTAATGAAYPLVAVQRYGRGRSMVFAGEASWRWKMLMPAEDRSFELFWRQTARWLVSASPDRVALNVPRQVEAGDDVAIEVDVRDAAFAPMSDASLVTTLTGPEGADQPVTLRRSEANGRYVARVRVPTVGLYHVHVDARARSGSAVGTADDWINAGSAAREFADPRLNEAYLRRVARASGGRYVPAAEAARVPSWLQSSAASTAPPQQRDLWHEPWAFGIVVTALCGEWILRRRWGLR